MTILPPATVRALQDIIDGDVAAAMRAGGPGSMERIGAMFQPIVEAAHARYPTIPQEAMCAALPEVLNPVLNAEVHPASAGELWTLIEQRLGRELS